MGFAFFTKQQQVVLNSRDQQWKLWFPNFQTTLKQAFAKNISDKEMYGFHKNAPR